MRKEISVQDSTLKMKNLRYKFDLVTYLVPAELLGDGSVMITEFSQWFPRKLISSGAFQKAFDFLLRL
jgi:hypothetical protein